MSAGAGTRTYEIQIDRVSAAPDAQGEPVDVVTRLATVRASVEQAPRGVDDLRFRAEGAEERVEYIVVTAALNPSIEIRAGDRITWLARELWIVRVYEHIRTLVIYADYVVPRSN